MTCRLPHSCTEHTNWTGPQKQVDNYNYFVSQNSGLKLVFPILIFATSSVDKQVDNYNVHLAWQIIKLFEMILTALLG